MWIEGTERPAKLGLPRPAMIVGRSAWPAEVAALGAV